MSMKDKMKRRRANSINLSLAANSNYVKSHQADDIINKFITDVKKADITSGPLESETVLEDDYPIYPGYTYLADGKMIIAMYPCSVAFFKNRENVKEVRRCDLAARNFF